MKEAKELVKKFGILGIEPFVSKESALVASEYSTGNELRLLSELRRSLPSNVYAYHYQRINREGRRMDSEINEV